jgi:hypothetical protein
MGNIKVSDAHVDHYIRLDGVEGQAAAWWDGFTGLTVVVAQYSGSVDFAINSSHLVSVIDRNGSQTFAWAFDSYSDVQYIAEKIPAKAFNNVWRQRLAESIRLMLRLHEQAVATARPA